MTSHRGTKQKGRPNRTNPADCRFGFEADNGHPLFERCNGSCHAKEDTIEEVTLYCRKLGILSDGQACLDHCLIVTRDEKKAYLAEDEQMVRPHSYRPELTFIEQARIDAYSTATASEN